MSETRTIKFRWKSKENWKWYHWSLFEGRFYDFYITWIWVYKGSVPFIKSAEIERETIWQYTNLSDKYNKEIFEWDILSTKFSYWMMWELTNTFNWVVKEEDWCYIVVYKVGQEEHKKKLKEMLENSEIIWNIHDNPELLDN